MKKFSLLLAVVAVLAVLTACGAKSTRPSGAPMPQMGENEPSAASVNSSVTFSSTDTAMPMDGGTGKGDLLPISRKLVLNANLRLESTDFEATCKMLTDEITALGGYVESSSLEGGSQYEEQRRYAEYSVRIPQDKYSTFIDKAGEAGNLLSKQENVQDITAQYVDVEARLKSLRAQEESLLKILEKAEKLEDVIAVQDSLTNVQYQIESYTSQQRLMDSEVSYSKITIFVNEVKRATEKQDNFAQRISAAFKNGMYSFGEGLQRLAISIIYNLPMLFIFVAFVVVVIFFLRHTLAKNGFKAVAQKHTEKEPENKPKDNTQSTDENSEN